MTIKVYPFASGSGQQVNEDEWRWMFGAWRGHGYGVIPPSGMTSIGSALQVTDISDGTTWKVRVSAGRAHIGGHVFHLDSQMDISLGPRTSDVTALIVAVVDTIAKTGSIEVQNVTNTQQIPPVTRIPTWRLVLPLAYALGNAAANSFNVLDRRYPAVGTWRFTRSLNFSVSPADGLVKAEFTDATFKPCDFYDLPVTEVEIGEDGVYSIAARGTLTSNGDFALYIIVESGGAAIPGSTEYTIFKNTNQGSVGGVAYALNRGDKVYLYVSAPTSTVTFDYVALTLTRIQ